MGLESWIESFRMLLEGEVDLYADPAGFSEWIEQVRFSETERFQLRRLLLQWQALDQGPALFPVSFPPGITGSRSWLSAIRLTVREASPRIF